MNDALDVPTVLRAGAGTLGQPVLSLAYRGVPEAASAAQAPRAPLPEDPRLDSVLRTVEDHTTRLFALEAAVRRLERPWWVRLSQWLGLRVGRGQ